MNQQTLLTFQVDARHYALAARDVERVVPMAKLELPPGAPKLLLGFLDLGSRPVAVVRLHHLFGLGETPLHLWTPLIVLAGPSQTVALLASRVEQVMTVEQDDFLPLGSNHVLNACASGIVRCQGTAVVVLSAERLLLEEERRSIAELQEVVAARRSELAGVPA